MFKNNAVAVAPRNFSTSLLVLLCSATFISCDQNPNGQANPNPGAPATSFQLPQIVIRQKPPIPVIMTQRDTLTGTKALIFSNQTDHQLTITVALGKDGKYDPGKNADLPPNGRMTLGWLEGFALYPGMEVRISHPDYSSRAVKISD